MIVTCPACNIRYRVEDAAVGNAGRDVRCAGCGHTWHQAPPIPPLPVARAPIAAPRPAIPVEIPAPPGEPTPLVASLRPSPTPDVRHSWGIAAFLGVAFVVAAAAAGLIVGRDRIAAAWPATIRYYQLVGIKLEPLGAGLEISRISPTRTADALIIEGDITNTAATPRSVPRLRVALRDANQREIEFTIVDPPVGRLLPGEVVHFKTPFPRPNDAASGVAVTFAAG